MIIGNDDIEHVMCCATIHAHTRELAGSGPCGVRVMSLQNAADGLNIVSYAGKT